MGMCKGCHQIFKTETMTNGFCKKCQETPQYKEYLSRIDNGSIAEEKIKDKKFFYILTWVILFPLIIYCLYTRNYHFAFILAIFPLIGTFSLLEDIFEVKKKRKAFLEKNTNSNKNKRKKSFLKTYYKHIYFLIILLIILFPPHYNPYNKWIRYEFILGSSKPIHFGTFFAEIIAIVFIGIAFYILFIKNRPKETL